MDSLKTSFALWQQHVPRKICVGHLRKLSLQLQYQHLAQTLGSGICDRFFDARRDCGNDFEDCTNVGEWTVQENGIELVVDYGISRAAIRKSLFQSSSKFCRDKCRRGEG